MFNISRSMQPTLGIYISNSRVRVLQLSAHKQRYRIDHIASYPLPENCISERVISNIESVAQCIKKAVQQSRSQAKQCIMAVPGSSVMSKIISMPADLSDEELEAQINLEADQHIPFPLNEVNIDYHVIEGNQTATDQIDVLLVCSKTSNIASRVAVAELADLTPIVIDIESYITERSFPYLKTVHSQSALTNSSQLAPEEQDQQEHKTVAIFDIGATVTSLNVIQDGQLIYTREHDFGGKQLTEQIMEAYQSDFQTAEHRKLSKRLLDDGLLDNGLVNDNRLDDYEIKILKPFKHTLAQQCNRCLQFFYSVKPSIPVQQILLCGGCANITDIDDIVEQTLDIPTNVIDPLANLDCCASIDKTLLKLESSSFLVALGLALRQFAH